MKNERLLSGKPEEEDERVIEYTAVEIYRTLINEKQGKIDDKEKSDKMRSFIQEKFKTDKIETIQLEDLKKAVEGDNMISRIKYRKQVGSMMVGKRPQIGKGQILKEEHAHADHIDDK